LADPHAAETDRRDLEAAAAEFTCLHDATPFDWLREAQLAQSGRPVADLRITRTKGCKSAKFQWQLSTQSGH
jgi:hypothetical protein